MTDDLTPQRLEAIKKLGITRETAAGLFVSVEEHAEALARIEELEAEVRELCLQMLATDGQAQEAYEAQLKAEAALRDAEAKALERAAKVADQALKDATCMTCGHPRSNHPYRHPFVTMGATDPAAAIRALIPQPEKE